LPSARTFVNVIKPLTGFILVRYLYKFLEAGFTCVD